MVKMNDVKKTIAVTSIVAGSFLSLSLLRSETSLPVPKTTKSSINTNQKIIHELIRKDAELEKKLSLSITENKKLIKKLNDINHIYKSELHPSTGAVIFGIKRNAF